MSTRFTIFCADCEVAGPHIRRHHDTAIFMEQGSARFFPASAEKSAADEWGQFLLEHEYHDLVLECERERKLWDAKHKAERLEREKPTHRLMSDGSLEEL